MMIRSRTSTPIFSAWACALLGAMTLASAAGADQISVNPFGYLPKAPKKVVCDAVVAGKGAVKVFRLLDAEGRVVFEGPLKPDTVLSGPSDTTIDPKTGKARYAMPCHLGDFTAFTTPGEYRVTIGAAVSPVFPIGDAAVRNYLAVLNSAGVTWCHWRRSGDPKINNLHLDDGRREDNNEWQDFHGGWFDAEDLRKNVICHAQTVNGMLELLDLGVYDTALLLEEARWGNDYMHRMQDKEGYTYRSQARGKRKGGENDHTDNVPRTDDDRIFCTKSNTLAVNYLFVAAQARMYSAFREKDPDYAKTCLDRGLLAYRYCDKHFDELHESTLAMDPWRKQGALGGTDMRTDPMGNYACGMYAGLYLWRATGGESYKTFAIRMAGKLMSLQQTEPMGTRNPIRGFFYTDDTRTKGLPYAVVTGMWLIAMCDLYEAFPEHPDAAKWRESIRMYIHECAGVIAKENDFGIIPYCISLGDFRNPARNHGGCYHRYFKGPPDVPHGAGRNHVLASIGAGMAHAARLFKDPLARDLAWHQFNWVCGINTMFECQVTGVGRDRRTGNLTLADKGLGVINGPNGNEDDCSRTRVLYQYGEVWMPNTAGFAWLLQELLLTEGVLPMKTSAAPAATSSRRGDTK